MNRLEETPCPMCGAPSGSLFISERYAAKKTGTWSLAGHQPKVVVTPFPVLKCSLCDLEAFGTYDSDGRHVSFPAQATVSESIEDEGRSETNGPPRP